MFDDLIDAFYDIFDVFESIWSFLWALIKFIVFWFKTVLNLIYQAFTYIFSTDLYNWISDTIDSITRGQAVNLSRETNWWAWAVKTFVWWVGQMFCTAYNSKINECKDYR